MRDLEESMNGYIRQKLLNVKEDMLQSNPTSRVKRNMRIMAQITEGSSGSQDWKLRLEGKIMNHMSESDILKSDKRFLKVFEKIQVTFPDQEYPSVNWLKSKCEESDQLFDALEITRGFTKE